MGGRGKARLGACSDRRRIKPKKGKSRLSIRFHQVQILAVKYFMKRASDRPTMPLIMPHMCPYRPGAIYSTPGEPQRPLTERENETLYSFPPEVLISQLESVKRVSHGNWHKNITRESYALRRADSESSWAGLAGSMQGMGRAASCKGA